MLCGTAYRNKGVQPLLDAVVDYLPTPLNIGEVEGHKVGDESTVMTRKPSIDEPFSALAFKIAVHPFFGKLTFVRVYSGIVEPGAQVANSTKGKRERIGKLFQMHANKENPVDEARAGNIYAFIGLKDTTTGDTLCDLNDQIILESMDFPDPVIEVAIEPKTKSDQEKLSTAIQKLAEEDPTFTVKLDEETGQTVIGGMGELHLDVLVDRMKREFKLRTVRPSVSRLKSWNTLTRSRLVVPVSSPASSSVLSLTLRPPTSLRKASPQPTSSTTLSPVAVFRRNTSPPWTLVSRTRCSTASSPASRW